MLKSFTCLSLLLFIPVTTVVCTDRAIGATAKYGVNISCGDLDGDSIDEFVTGPNPGPQFDAHVRGWDYDGSVSTPLPGMSSLPGITSRNVYPIVA